MIGQGRFAVVGCAERRIQLWADRTAADQTSIQPDPLMCGPECPGNHLVQVLPDERSGAESDE
jgi:hypothetical protein